MVLYFF